METDYLAHYQRQLAIRKYIFYVIVILIIMGFPTWHYVDAYQVAVTFKNLGHTEIYTKRMDEALKVSSIMMIALALIIVPFFIKISNRFYIYRKVVGQLQPLEIATLKTINNSLLPFGKYLPTFIITAENLHIFSTKYHAVPFKQIVAHNIKSYSVRHGIRYSIEIKTMDGGYYAFNISNNPVELQQLNLVFAK